MPIPLGPIAAAAVARAIIAKSASKAAVKKVTGARAAKDAKTVASSAYLKQTPGLTLKQAKRMKQGTKSLAKTTKKIARQTSRDKNWDTKVGDYNDFLTKIGRDKPTTFPPVTSPKFPGKEFPIPSLGGKINAPAGMTMSQVKRGEALAESQKAKDYAAQFRQIKREVKSLKKASESPTTKTVKKAAKITTAAGATGAAYTATSGKGKSSGGSGSSSKVAMGRVSGGITGKGAKNVNPTYNTYL
jgi:hypothetical protein